LFAPERASRAATISLTAAAFDAIAATLPLGSVGFESEVDAKAKRAVWVAPAVAISSQPRAGPAKATATSSCG